MEKGKVVTIDNPVAIAGLTLIPVVEVSLNYWQANGITSFFGVKQPVAVILVSPSSKRAFRITGEEVSIGQLVQEVPAIEEILERL